MPGGIKGRALKSSSPRPSSASGLNDDAAATLANVIAAKGGLKAVQHPQYARAILNDYLYAFRGERKLILIALDYGVPRHLSSLPSNMPPSDWARHLATQLSEVANITVEAALWAVSAWARALGHPQQDRIQSGQSVWSTEQAQGEIERIRSLAQSALDEKRMREASALLDRAVSHAGLFPVSLRELQIRVLSDLIKIHLESENVGLAKVAISTLQTLERSSGAGIGQFESLAADLERVQRALSARLDRPDVAILESSADMWPPADEWTLGGSSLVG